MKGLLRIPIYLVLIAVCTVSVQRFLTAYNARAERAAHRYDRMEENLPEYGASSPADAQLTNEPATNPPPGNAIAGPTNLPATAQAGSNTPPAITAPAKPSGEPTSDHLGLYAAAGLLSLLVLALAGSYEISHFVGQRAHQFMTSDDADGAEDAEYEEAEQFWANGDYLGAVHSLREYLKRHPRRIHAYFRIAEIYEKDLRNPLAAALEHEEILKFKLEAERWGWAAIHLCNLYYHLNQEEKAETLLHRIVNEFGHTQAARKARKRLGLPEDTEAVETAEEEEEKEEKAEEAVTKGGFKLPPGFRPKK